MIKFVDLRPSADALGGRFAWFNTVSSYFIMVGGEQVWSTWDEFVEITKVSPDKWGPADVERFRSLAPEWVFKPVEEDVKAPDDHWKRIGYITIDSGLCWIGDPSYILHNELHPSVGVDWQHFCHIIENRAHKAFGNGFGVVTSTGYGDGIYPVEVLKAGGRVRAVRVVFEDYSEEVPNMKEKWDEERG